MSRIILLNKLIRRGSRYSIVGLGTFLLDMGILSVLLTWTPMPYPLAVALGFFTGVSINYYIAYHWVYAGTVQTFYHGYSFFIIVAIGGVLVITLSTTILVEFFYIPIFIARIFMGAIIGTVNFFVNTFFNFRIL